MGGDHGGVDSVLVSLFDLCLLRVFDKHAVYGHPGGRGQCLDSVTEG